TRAALERAARRLQGPPGTQDPAAQGPVVTSKVYVALRVKASPERAFAAFVDEIGAWWRPNMLFQTTPRPGVLSFEPGPDGRLVETRAGGKVFEIGRIVAWEPPHRLVFSWRQANFPPDLHTEVEVCFEA